MAYIAWLHACDDEGPVGGKGRSLARLHRAGFPVPAGFCITAEGYRSFAAYNGLAPLVADICRTPGLQDPKAARDALAPLLARLQGAVLPPDLEREVREAHRALRAQCHDGVTVAVRSSAASEDGAAASFAGLYETYLNLREEAEVVEAVRACYSSLWSHRAVHYRAVKGIDHAGEAMGVVVMELVPSRVSGITFTVNPVTGNREEIVINASWGLGEAVVSGRVTPDTFVVHKPSLRLLRKEIYEKEVQVRPRRDGGGTIIVEVPSGLAAAPALEDDRVVEVARLARDIESHYGRPQDVEWAFHGDRLYVLQARPITALG